MAKKNAKNGAEVSTASANVASEILSSANIIGGHRPEFMYLPVDDLVIDPTNPREVERFNTNKNRIKASIVRSGYKANHPIAARRMPVGKLRVMVGNSRTQAVQELKSADPALFAKLFPDGTIPALVYSGLSDAEAEILSIDHSKDEDRQELNAWEQFLAVKKLLAVGCTQDEIANRLGWITNRGANAGMPRRSYVQQRATLAKLPTFVQDAMHKVLNDDTDALKLQWADIPTLYKAFNDDNPAGLPFPQGGPAFKAEWEKIVNPPVNPAGAAVKPEPLTVAEAKKIQAGYSSTLFRQIILLLTGQLGRPDLTRADYDAVLKRMEDSHPELLAKFQAPPVAPVVDPETVAAAGKATNTPLPDKPVKKGNGKKRKGK